MSNKDLQDQIKKISYLKKDKLFEIINTITTAPFHIERAKLAESHLGIYLGQKIIAEINIRQLLIKYENSEKSKILENKLDDYTALYSR